MYNNQFHGKGTFSYFNKQKYTGEFKNSLFDGPGIFEYNDGTNWKFEGTFLQNKKQGFGINYYVNGVILKCSYNSDKMHGKAVY